VQPFSGGWLGPCASRREAETTVARTSQSPSYTGLGFDELCRMHLSKPERATRSALLTSAIVSRADALASLGVIANTDDALLHERLVGKLHVYLSVM
jgi:hypothetical protein